MAWVRGACLGTTGVAAFHGGDPIINVWNAERGVAFLVGGFAIVALLVGSFAVGADDAKGAGMLRTLGC